MLAIIELLKGLGIEGFPALLAVACSILFGLLWKVTSRWNAECKKDRGKLRAELKAATAEINRVEVQLAHCEEQAKQANSTAEHAMRALRSCPIEECPNRHSLAIAGPLKRD